MGVGLGLDLDRHLQGILQAPGSAAIGALPGFKSFKALPAVFAEPGLQHGDADLSDPVPGKGQFLPGLFPEVVVLGPGRFGQYVKGDVVHWVQKDIYNSRRIGQECPMLGHTHLCVNERKKRRKTFHHRATENTEKKYFSFAGRYRQKKTSSASGGGPSAESHFPVKGA